MAAKKSPSRGSDSIDAGAHTGVDKYMRPTRSGKASMKRAMKKAETEGKKVLQEDLADIDANFLRSRGQIISDWRVFNGHPPLDVEVWDAKYEAEEQKAMDRGEIPNTYWRDRKLLLPSSRGEPAFRNVRALGWNSLYPDTESPADDEQVEEPEQGSLKRKEIPNSTDDEEDNEPVTKRLRSGPR